MANEFRRSCGQQVCPLSNEVSLREILSYWLDKHQFVPERTWFSWLWKLLVWVVFFLEFTWCSLSLITRKNLNRSSLDPNLRPKFPSCSEILASVFLLRHNPGLIILSQTQTITNISFVTELALEFCIEEEFWYSWTVWLEFFRFWLFFNWVVIHFHLFSLNSQRNSNHYFYYKSSFYWLILFILIGPVEIVRRVSLRFQKWSQKEYNSGITYEIKQEQKRLGTFTVPTKE